MNSICFVLLDTQRHFKTKDKPKKKMDKDLFPPSQPEFKDVSLSNLIHASDCIKTTHLA